MPDVRYQYRSCVVDENGIAEQIVEKNLETYFVVKMFGEHSIKKSAIYSTKSGDYKPYPTDHPFFASAPVAFATEIPTNPKPLAEIIADILAFLAMHMDMDETAKLVAAYYVVYTYAYDEFEECPYLHVLADLGAGKTKLGKILSLLAYKCLRTSGAATASPIFRTLDQFRGTLWLDEYDFTTQSERSQELASILNVGYSSDSPYLRTEDLGKGRLYPAVYHVYGPKIITGRSPLADNATESRCFRLYLTRTERHWNEQLALAGQTPKLGQPVKRFTLHFSADMKAQLTEMRNHLLAWRMSTRGHHLLTIDPTIVKPTWSPRLTQLIQLLMTIVLPEHHQRIISFADDMEDRDQKGRATEYATDVLEVLTDPDCIAGRVSLGIGEIAAKVTQRLATAKPVTANTISKIINGELNLKTAKSGRNRNTHVFFADNEEKIVRLCRHRGIEFAGYDGQTTTPSFDDALAEVFNESTA